MTEALENIVYRLAHCMILFGTEHELDFISFEGSKKDLLRAICDSPKERIIDFIHQELLEH